MATYLYISVPVSEPVHQTYTQVMISFKNGDSQLKKHRAVSQDDYDQGRGSISAVVANSDYYSISTLSLHHDPPINKRQLQRFKIISLNNRFKTGQHYIQLHAAVMRERESGSNILSNAMNCNNTHQYSFTENKWQKIYAKLKANAHSCDPDGHFPLSPTCPQPSNSKTFNQKTCPVYLDLNETRQVEA